MANNSHANQNVNEEYLPFYDTLNSLSQKEKQQNQSYRNLLTGSYQSSNINNAQGVSSDLNYNDQQSQDVIVSYQVSLEEYIQEKSNFYIEDYPQCFNQQNSYKKISYSGNKTYKQEDEEEIKWDFQLEDEIKCNIFNTNIKCRIIGEEILFWKDVPIDEIQIINNKEENLQSLFKLIKFQKNEIKFRNDHSEIEQIKDPDKTFIIHNNFCWGQILKIQLDQNEEDELEDNNLYEILPSFTFHILYSLPELNKESFINMLQDSILIRLQQEEECLFIFNQKFEAKDKQKIPILIFDKSENKYEQAVNELTQFIEFTIKDFSLDDKIQYITDFSSFKQILSSKIDEYKHLFEIKLPILKLQIKWKKQKGIKQEKEEENIHIYLIGTKEFKIGKEDDCCPKMSDDFSSSYKIKIQFEKSEKKWYISNNNNSSEYSLWKVFDCQVLNKDLLFYQFKKKKSTFFKIEEMKFEFSYCEPNDLICANKEIQTKNLKNNNNTLPTILEYQHLEQEDYENQVIEEGKQENWEYDNSENHCEYDYDENYCEYDYDQN